MPIHPVPTPRPAPVGPEEEEFDLSNLGGPNDDEEDEEMEVPDEEVAPVEPEPETPKRRGRPKKPLDPKPIGLGAAQVTPKSAWRNRNLEVLWPEVLEFLRNHHYNPWDVDVRVKRTEPQEMLIGTPFPGGVVAGSEGRAASTQIVEKITDEYHLVSGSLGPASYKVEIIWRISSKVLTWGTLRLASPDAILAMRRQQQQQQDPSLGNRWQSPPAYAPAPQYPAPFYPSHVGYGAPPSNVPSGSDAEMRAEIGYLRGTLDEVMRAFREGRQPNIQPPPPTAPSAPPSVDDIARRVVEMLRPAGLGAPPVVAAATVAPTPAVSTFEASVQTIMQGMMQGVLKKVAGSVDQAIRGDGATQPTEAVAEVMPDDPKEDLPFTAIPVGSKWPDGRDVFFPKKKSDGTIDYMGVLAANPFLMEKLADSASGLIGSVGDLVKNLGRAAIPGAAEVVQHIPRGAVQAGVGQTPSSQPNPPAPTAIPHTNGVPVPPPSHGGWPTG